MAVRQANGGAHAAAGVAAVGQHALQRTAVARLRTEAQPLRAQAQADPVARLRVELRLSRGDALPGVGEHHAVRIDRLHPALQQVRLSDELRGEAGGGVIVDLLGSAHLLKAAATHHGDAVGHVQGLLLIVGDVDEGDAQALLNVLQLHLHLAPQLQIQRAQGLVQQQQLRLKDQRAGDGHALALSAGELGRHALFAALQLHQAQHLRNLRPPLGTLHAAHAQSIGDVLFHIHVGKQGIILKDGVDVALLRRRVGDVPAREIHAPGVRLQQARDDAQRGGLAAARRAQQRDELPRLHIKAEAAQDLRSLEGLFQPLHPQQRF